MLWGEAGEKGTRQGHGLAHILRRRSESGQDGEALIKSIPEIISKGEINKKDSSTHRVYIDTPDHRAIIRLDWNGKAKKWLVSAFEFYPHLKAGRLSDIASLKDGATSIPAPQAKDSNILPQPDEVVKGATNKKTTGN
ncbi:MAG: hypothetical protein HQK98_07600 [Nitrospirae bacterium]|nr:hypothetical protein [Nitrospirota bacterium]